MQIQCLCKLWRGVYCAEKSQCKNSILYYTAIEVQIKRLAIILAFTSLLKNALYK